jgi:hypothetical protein
MSMLATLSSVTRSAAEVRNVDASLIDIVGDDLLSVPLRGDPQRDRLRH